VRGINRPSGFLLLFAIKADRSTEIGGAHEPEAPVDLARFTLYHRTADSLAPRPAESDSSPPLLAAQTGPRRVLSPMVCLIVNVEGCQPMNNYKEPARRKMLRMKEGTYFPSQA